MTAIDSAEILNQITTLLDKANSKRRTRTLVMEQVMDLVDDVASRKLAWSWEDGGTVANAYRQTASTAVALAARVGDRVFLGITTADAKSTTPGRAWKSLQPWKRDDGPNGDSATKWAAWTESDNVIEIPLDLIRN